MYKTKSELYELVKDQMTEDKFNKEIAKRYNEYEELLSEDAIAYLIVDELGKNLIETVRISDLKDGDSVSLEVKVEDIKKPREFKRKNGTMGQVANLFVTDESATCRLTLWDKDVEAVLDGKIKKGSKIRIVNGYVKDSSFGLEINIGKWGLFFVR
jgi:replication factor A1